MDIKNVKKGARIRKLWILEVGGAICEAGCEVTLNVDFGRLAYQVRPAYEGGTPRVLTFSSVCIERRWPNHLQTRVVRPQSTPSIVRALAAINRERGLPTSLHHFSLLSPLFFFYLARNIPEALVLIPTPEASPEAPKISRSKVSKPKLCPREPRFWRKHPGFSKEYYFKRRGVVRSSSYQVSV